jgi:hypothetical protein
MLSWGQSLLGRSKNLVKGKFSPNSPASYSQKPRKMHSSIQSRDQGKEDSQFAQRVAKSIEGIAQQQRDGKLSEAEYQKAASDIVTNARKDASAAMASKIAGRTIHVKSPERKR